MEAVVVLLIGTIVIGLISFVMGIAIGKYIPVAVSSGVVMIALTIIISMLKSVDVKTMYKPQQDSIWITAHDGKRSNFNPQTDMNEVPYVDSLGEEFLLIKVKFNKKNEK